MNSICTHPLRFFHPENYNLLLKILRFLWFSDIENVSQVSVLLSEIARCPELQLALFSKLFSCIHRNQYLPDTIEVKHLAHLSRRLTNPAISGTRVFITNPLRDAQSSCTNSGVHLEVADSHFPCFPFKFCNRFNGRARCTNPRNPAPKRPLGGKCVINTPSKLVVESASPFTKVGYHRRKRFIQQATPMTQNQPTGIQHEIGYYPGDSIQSSDMTISEYIEEEAPAVSLSCIAYFEVTFTEDSSSPTAVDSGGGACTGDADNGNMDYDQSDGSKVSGNLSSLYASAELPMGGAIGREEFSMGIANPLFQSNKNKLGFDIFSFGYHSCGEMRHRGQAYVQQAHDPESFGSSLDGAPRSIERGTGIPPNGAGDNVACWTTKNLNNVSISPAFKVGDTLGCGLIYPPICHSRGTNCHGRPKDLTIVATAAQRKGEVFFTRNGVLVLCVDLPDEDSLSAPWFPITVSTSLLLYFCLVMQFLHGTLP